MTPTDEELAAVIAAAVALLRESAPATPSTSRWALAQRLPLRDASEARAAQQRSAWNASGRLG
jgi:hypothetical protein